MKTWVMWPVLLLSWRCSLARLSMPTRMKPVVGSIEALS